MSRGARELRLSMLALGAAASVPLVVAVSEGQAGFGTKALSYLASLWLASSQESLPPATAGLDSLYELLTETTGATRHIETLGDAQRREVSSSAAAVLAASAHTAQHVLPVGAAAARLPSPRLVDSDEACLTSETLSLDAVEQRAPPGRQATAVELAARCPADAAAMRQHLAERGLATLPERFSDVELMRYAITKGYLRARTPEQRQDALQQGAAMAASTVEWLAQHPFESSESLQRWGRLLWWQDTAPSHPAASIGSSSGSPRPVLHIAIGAAVNECRTAPAAMEFANAIITQLHHAVEHKLGEGPGQANSIVVVMDCSGGSPLTATRIAWVFKSVCTSLNSHFPGRLHELVLLDLPVVLSWLVGGVKKLMHPDTRGKVRVVRTGQEVAHPGAAAAAVGGE